MSEQTKIQWCDHTFNPWEGCTKVSPGCLHCYAETRNHRFGMDNWGKGKPRRRTSASNWKQPLKWNRDADAEYHQAIEDCKIGGLPFDWHRPRVFCASLADWLDDEVPIDCLADLLKLIHDTPNLDWLLLTKRPENFFALLQCAWRYMATRSDLREATQWVINWENRGQFPQNVWIGTSVEDQKRADERIPELLQIPAKIHFLSVEPMLGPIDFDSVRHGNDPDLTMIDSGMIHWAIFGGESGPGARPCDMLWIQDGIRQCRAAGVAPFVKQLGSIAACGNANCFDFPDDEMLASYGEGAAAVRLMTRDSKGGDMAEWPEDLRIREFPSRITHHFPQR